MLILREGDRKFDSIFSWTARMTPILTTSESIIKRVVGKSQKMNLHQLFDVVPISSEIHRNWNITYYYYFLEQYEIVSTLSKPKSYLIGGCLYRYVRSVWYAICPLANPVPRWLPVRCQCLLNALWSGRNYGRFGLSAAFTLIPAICIVTHVHIHVTIRK